jgi:hypothetical protein
VDFNERLDVSLELNLFGSLRVLELAKACVSAVCGVQCAIWSVWWRVWSEVSRA